MNKQLKEHTMLERRLLYIPIIHIDTNLINARQKLEAVNQLEQWNENGVILLNMSHVNHKESMSGDSELRVKKANTYIYTIEDEPSYDIKLYKHLESIIFPDGVKSTNQHNDIYALCEATKYGAIFVTNDGASKTQPGGILGNRKYFKDVLTVLSAEEAVDFVKTKIKERDDFNKQCAQLTNTALPEWTDQD
jgi:hypothetical protein